MLTLLLYLGKPRFKNGKEKEKEREKEKENEKEKEKEKESFSYSFYIVQYSTVQYNAVHKVYFPLFSC